MPFSVIHLAPGLSLEDHARAVEIAPEFVELEVDYPTLLDETGWAIRQRHDLTDAFMASCIRTLHTEENLRADLESLIGADFDARQMRMRRRIVALEQGHLVPALFIVEPSE